MVYFTASALAQGLDEDLGPQQGLRGLHWSPLTNGVALGLAVEPARSNAVFTDYTIELACHGTTTNETILWFPPEPERYALELMDANGHKVGKTFRGKKLGKQFRWGGGFPDRQGYSYTRAPSTGVATLPPAIPLSALFNLKQPGTNTLIGEIRALVVRKWSAVPAAFTPPPIEIQIKRQD
jgi:hypothetical protein